MNGVDVAFITKMRCIDSIAWEKSLQLREKGPPRRDKDINTTKTPQSCSCMTSNFGRYMEEKDFKEKAIPSEISS